MIRYVRAKPDEAALLTKICRSSKALWGYDPVLLEQWQDELSISENYIDQFEVLKIIYKDALAGFFAIENHISFKVLEHFWILPRYTHQGIGTNVLNHIKNQLIDESQELRLVADPNAEQFYRQNAFITYGYFNSNIEGRKLPKMKWSKKDVRSPD